jgi:hypothetical protein
MISAMQISILMGVGQNRVWFTWRRLMDGLKDYHYS